MATSKVIDIDKRAGSFTPVQVIFRKKKYVLGENAMDLINVSSVFSTLPRGEDETDVQYAGRLIEPVLRAASPALAAVIDKTPLKQAETFAFMPVLTEVMKSVGSIRF